MVSHHPVVRAQRVHDVLAGMTQVSAADQAFHAILMVFMTVVLYALAVFTFAFRSRLLLSLAALSVFGTGFGAIIGAALIDGFFVPAFAHRYAPLPPNLQNYAVPILTSDAIAIQLLTKLGLFAFAAAAVLWACELLQQNKSARIAGVVAAAAALAQFAVTAATGTLNPHNLAVLMLLQSVWCMAFAWQLWVRSELTQT